MTALFLFMVFAPALTSFALFFLKINSEDSRKLGLLVSGLVMLVSFYIYYAFDKSLPGLQFMIDASWISSIGARFIMAMDGLSLSLVLLTTILTFITIIFLGKDMEKGHFYVAMILFLQTTLTGVFVSFDLLLFYLFWELVLIPMYFMILEWGGPNRRYAAIKFFIYTHVGSLLMLVGFIAMFFFKGQVDGVYTLSIIEFLNFSFPKWFQLIAAPLLFVAFAFKLPLVPFHTWLPDAHVEAPTAGSILLAGVMLKMGGYGLIRLGIQMFPEAAVHYSYPLALLGVISMVYGAVLALAQDDLKKMIAYSSVSHMGSVALGLAALNLDGLNGATYQLFAHGIISAMMFMVCGILQYSFDTRDMRLLGGLGQKVPILSSFFVFSFMASLGLPGLAGFVAEINVFMGVFGVYRLLALVAIASLVITAGYYLWAIERTFYGEVNPRLVGKDFADVKPNEKLALVMLTGLIFIFGVLPGPIMNILNISNIEILARIGGVN